MADDVIAALLEKAGDAIYAHPQVRWVLLEPDGRQVVVLRDDTSYELRLVPVPKPE